MSAAKVWVNGAWKTVDTKGSPGDIGNTGAAGTNTLTATGMTFSATRTNMADGQLEPVGLAASGATSAAPCMTVSGGNRLAAVLSGMYAINLEVDYSVGTAGDAENWFLIARVTPDAEGDSYIGVGENPRTGSMSNVAGLGWFNAGAVVSFPVQKQTGGVCTVTWLIRAVMLQ